MSSEAPSGRPVSILSDPSTFDDLADLFLGDDPSPASTPQPADRSIRVAALVIGHLPVIAAPWISQHARDIARNDLSPVAVLSKSGDRTTLDLYNTPEIAEQHSISGAIEQALSAGCRRWLVRTDAVSELSLSDHPRVDAVTLLTGADDAAVVGSYRAIKGLVSEGSELDEQAFTLNLAVMGSDPVKSRAAAEKIRKAARSFLQAGLADVTLSERVSAGSTSFRIFDGSSDTSLDELLRLIPAELPAQNSAQQIQSTESAAASNLRLASQLIETESIAASQNADAAEAPRVQQTEPISASRVGPMGNQSNSHASLLGLTAIEAKCPYADDIEIAVDHEGRPHLIASTVGQDIARSIESLQIAQSWIGAHISLVAAATGGKIRTNPPMESSMHLIVEHAASARRLLDGDMSIYVFAKGNQESLCVPLN
jgi:hypothetical protein